MPRLTVNQICRNNQNNENISSLTQENSNEPISTKRLATSPAKGALYKRSAFGNISNALQRKTVVNSYDLSKETQAEKEKTKSNRRSLRLQAKAYLSKPSVCSDVNPAKKSEKQSNPNNFSSQEIRPSSEKEPTAIDDSLKILPLPIKSIEHTASPQRRLLNYVDFDLSNVNNINEAPDYAFTVFEYMRARESFFVIKPNHLALKQTELTPDMRAILVDWMVEVQENFELNHETLYLSVKLIDHYLQEVPVKRDKLQLIGATSMLIAAKFDERHPPYIDDFLYICDNAYKRKDILSTEREILIRIGFDINIPISYRFLRRYAKCSKASMETLTLARFILELSLQCYSMAERSASHLAAAALWLSMKMKKLHQDWSDTLRYYTSRNEEDIYELAFELNTMIIESKPKKLKTIWQKYSHSIFYEVAKTAPLSDDDIRAERLRIQSQAMTLNDVDEKTFTNL